MSYIDFVLYKQVHNMISMLFLRVSAMALCLAGLFHMLDSGIDIIAPASNPGLGALVPICGLIGFAGFWLTATRQNTQLALLAFITGAMGLAGLVAVTFTVNRLLPDLAPQMKGQVAAALRTEFLWIGIIFLISALLICITTWHQGGLLRLGNVLYLAAAVIIGLRPFIPPSLHVLDGLMGPALLIWSLYVFDKSKT